MSRIITILLALTFIFFVTTTGAEASHKSKASRSPAMSASTKNGYINVNFSNLTNVKSVSYQLTYDTNSGPEGAGGTLKVRNSRNLSRRLFLGTCSKKHCRRHAGVKNIKVSADYTLKSGGVVSFEKSL